LLAVNPSSFKNIVSISYHIFDDCFNL